MKSILTYFALLIALSISIQGKETCLDLKRNMGITDVVVAVAMEAEAKPFIDHLKLPKIDDFFPPETPFIAYEGKHDDVTVTVVTNGKDNVYNTNVDNVGTVPAALVTFLTLQKLKSMDPKKEILVINAGTCGGFKRMGAEIGDVFLVNEVANHDRRIAIPPFIPYGIGNIKSEGANVASIAEALGFKHGVCTTGNSLDKTETDDKYMQENNASVKDMEAAAIAWSCELFKVPYMGIKVVTDIVDGGIPAQEEFLANLQKASESLQSALPKVFDSVCGK